LEIPLFAAKEYSKYVSRNQLIPNKNSNRKTAEENSNSFEYSPKKEKSLKYLLIFSTFFFTIVMSNMIHSISMQTVSFCVSK
jgi:hypothetical protein